MFIQMRKKKPYYFQKEKRRKWIFGRLKTKKLPSITAPKTISKETEEEKTKHSDSEDVVSATEVVSESTYPNQDNYEVPQSIYQFQMEIKEFSAIKIQTAFRGYLVSFFSLNPPFA